MKYKVCLLLAMLCLANFSYGQLKYEWGDKFDFDPKTELEPTFILKDNYNHFLLTVFNGNTDKPKVILRKFDQKNQLVQTFTHDFPAFDISTLHNYLGFAESDQGRVAVFTETYSGKAKKSSIYKHEFDKATAKFVSTEIISNPILSLGKSGTVSLEKSGNQNFIGINYTIHQSKDEPEKNLMLVLDANTFNVVWQKEFVFTDKYITSNFTVTNSGKVVFVRIAKGFKLHNYLVLASSQAQEEKRLETEIFLQQPKAISIGSQEYIVAFNYPAKGVSINRGDYSNLLLYDLSSGKTIQNAKISEFNTLRNITDIHIQKITIQDNEIQIFTEAEIKTEIKPGTPAVSLASLGNSYTFGPSNLIITSLDGTVKTIAKLSVDEKSRGELYHSFGLININGTYHLNTGNYNSFYSLDAAKNYQKSDTGQISFTSGDPLRSQNIKFVNQLVEYFPAGKRFLFARIINDREMSLVSVFGLK